MDSGAYPNSHMPQFKIETIAKYSRTPQAPYHCKGKRCTFTTDNPSALVLHHTRVHGNAQGDPASQTPRAKRSKRPIINLDAEPCKMPQCPACGVRCSAVQMVMQMDHRVVTCGPPIPRVLRFCPGCGLEAAPVGRLLDILPHFVSPI